MNHEERKKTLGASEISAACGRSRYQTRAELWELKTGRRKPFEGNRYTGWGNRLESVIAEAYFEQTPGLDRLESSPPVQVTGKPWAATPDRLVWTQANKTDKPDWILECKTASKDDDWGPSGSLDIPPEYYDQIQWQLYVTGLNRCDVAVLIGGSDFRVYSFARDPEHIDKLLTGAEEFWQFVETDIRPPDPPEIDKRTIPSNDEIDTLIRAITMNRGEMESLEGVIEEQRKVLMGLVPEGCSVKSDRGSAGWSERKPKPVTDWEAVARGMAADLAADLCESSSDPKAATPESVLADYAKDYTTVAPAKQVFTVRGKK